MRATLRTVIVCIVLALCLTPAAVTASDPVHWGI